MRPIKIILLILGILGVLIASGLMAGGGALIWVDRTAKDSEGFYTSGTIEVQRDSYAVISQPANINVRGTFTGNWSDLTTFKVDGSNNDETRGVFIGIARERDVREYLLNVKYDEVTDFHIHPSGIEYSPVPGDEAPDPPTEQTFWTNAVYGPGHQRIEWELESGTYVLVLMNDDGSPSMDLNIEVGARIPSLIWVGIGLLIGGIFALGIAVALIYVAVRRS